MLEELFLPASDEGWLSMAAVPSPAAFTQSRFTENADWFAVGEPEASQGWKVYVSATILNYLGMVKAITPVICELGLSFKYLKSLPAVGRMNSGARGFSQIGKCFVVYVPEGMVVPLLTRLKMILSAVAHAGPNVPRLPRAWHNAPVFYRYGSYRSEKVSIEGVDVPDDRTSPTWWRSAGIYNPFENFDAEQDRVAHKDTLSRFPILGEFCRSGKGGVFVGLDLECDEPREVIVKIGLKLGQVMLDGGDGYDLVEREAAMHEWLGNTEVSICMPKKIELVRGEAACCLVTEFIDAADLCKAKATGEWSVKYVEDALGVIEKMNGLGVRIVDAKASNFLHDGNRCWLIDLESTFVIDGRGPCSEPGPSTFELSGFRAGDCRFDELHFLISCLYSEKAEAPAQSCAGRQIDPFLFLEKCQPKDAVEDYLRGRMESLLCQARSPDC